MMFFSGCVCACRKSYSSLFNISQHLKVTSKFVPLRTFFSKKTSNEAEKINRSSDQEFLFKSFQGYDDEKFSDHAKYILTHPHLLKAVGVHFVNQFSQFYHEQVEGIKNLGNYRMDDKKDRIDMVFRFETKEDLNKFIVNSDSSFLMGNSSATLTLTEEGTALFSGNICTDIPKDGNVVAAGFANIISKVRKKSFNRSRNFDWTEHTHLVFKIRGDGRSYLINLNLKNEYEETSYTMYSHPLYTRGGPYWQIAKIPFSHFFVMTRGNLLDTQSGIIPLSRIHKFGITVSGNDGPFKLEIDYIGLEHDIYFNNTSPYEEYKQKSKVL